MLATSQENQKTFSDRLRERREFVQGEQNTALPVYERILDGGTDGVRISPTEVLNPLRGFTTEGGNMVKGAEADVKTANSDVNDKLQLLASLLNNQADRAQTQENKEREFQVKEQELGLNYNPKTKKLELSSSDPSTTAKAYADMVEQGSLKLENVPAANRNAVAKELSDRVSSGTARASKEKQTLVDTVDDLLSSDTKPITGVLQLESLVPGTPAQKMVNRFNQLQSMLSLENRQKLKGSGAISDFEARMLEKAASSLGRNLSDTDFKAVLKDLKEGLTKGGADQKSSGGFKIERVE